MSRWEPNAKGRLQQAALDLYQERGFDQTTVTEIAERAGLTERTFFRHFADKREVLFGEQETLLEICLSTIETAPDTATPIQIILTALEAMVPTLQERHDLIRQRQSVIAATPSLQERTLHKDATFTVAMADALKRRGIAAPAATLAANTGGLVFTTAYTRWAAESDGPDLSRLIQDSFEQLKSLVTT